CRDTGTVTPADVMPGGLDLGDVGDDRAAGAARAIRQVAREVRTADDEARLPDLAVLAGPGAPGAPGAQADPVRLAALRRLGVPRLGARGDEAIGVVGPLVEPGRWTCLRCVDLSKAARDPAWPMILAQAGGSAGGSAVSPQACGAVLAAATAALAAAQALAVIGRARPLVTAGGAPGGGVPGRH